MAHSERFSEKAHLRVGPAATVSVVLLALALNGCPMNRKGSPENGDKPPKTAVSTKKDKDKKNPGKVMDLVRVDRPKNDQPIVIPTKVARAIPLPAGVEAVEPKLIMSHGHADTCLKKIGETMSPIALPDVEGNEQTLTELLGEKLTVVVFWRIDHPYAKEQFMRLKREVVEPDGKHGVNVVAINEGDAAEAVRQLAEQCGAEFPILLDADGAAYDSVAAAKLPRTYLLDKTGKILWMEIEYSRSTRRELQNAILWHLKEGGAGPVGETL